MRNKLISIIVMIIFVTLAVSGGAFAKNKFVVKKAKIEKVLSPTMGVPVIVKQGDIVRVDISSDAMPHVTGVKFAMSGDGKPEKLEWNLATGEWIGVSVPFDIEPGLYDLIVEFEDGTTETQYHSVKVIDEYKKDFKFAVIADIHFGDTRGDYFAPGADFDTMRKNTLLAACGGDVEFVLLAGDVTSMPNDYTRDYEKAFNYFREYCDAPLFMVPGNHDGYGIRKGSDYFQDGILYWEKYFGRPYFYFDYGDMRVIGINDYDWPTKFRSSSNLAMMSETESINHANMSPAQFAWLQETAGGADSRNMIAFTHVELTKLLGGTTSKGGTYIPGVPKADVVKLLADAGVTHVFVGHMHRYETQNVSGIQQVMTNTSGSVLYDETQPWGFSFVHVKDWKVDSVEHVESKFD